MADRVRLDVLEAEERGRENEGSHQTVRRRAMSVQIDHPLSVGDGGPPTFPVPQRRRAKAASVVAFPDGETPMFSKRKEFIRLKNLQTGLEAVDTLHQSGILVCPVACTSQRCVGSMMTPSGGDQRPKRPHGVVRPREEVEEHARDFLNQYYGSLKSRDSPTHERRLAQVILEIEDRGTYNLTEKELAFGVKTAWRNAPRCIGRIQWNRLQLFDCRHVTTAAEMLDAIKQHIRFATNGGNIRSAITVFPQRLEGQSDFRVWNAQFFRYAAFKQEDGTILGDPASIEFTAICTDLGWKPEKEGPFVTLPIVLQARGQAPEWFDISDMNLEVDISHPEFEWFADLALKWYTVPAVANFLFDCGGIEFPAAPFSGWYMGSEVGRDFCDENRYNILPDVARRMGLDMRSVSSLWKDRALLEVNQAVLYSYQKSNVTISDHHSASESFMKHLEKEYATRGGCPADWVWVTPAISASTTPVFHQEMLMYQLKPSYEYQEDPWKIETHSKRRTRKDRFRCIATVVKTFSRMFKTSMSWRVKAVILYASETGRSATYAKKVGELFSYSFNYQVICMDEYDPLELEHEQMVVIVTSTFGNGEPPENGVEFFRVLKEKTTSDAENSRRLSNVKFSVFALGSRAYPNFCAFGNAMDRVLEELGGERVHDVGEGNELCGQEESFHKWMKLCYLITSCKSYHIDGGDKTLADKALSSLPPSWEEKMYRFEQEERTANSTPLTNTEALGILHHKKTATASVKRVKELQAVGASRSTILVEMNTGNHQLLAYNPGDHLGVCACNSSALVDAVLNKLQLDIDADATLVFEEQQRGHDGNYNGQWLSYDRFPEACSLRHALTSYLDITSPPSPQLISLMVELVNKEAPDAEAQKDKLKMLSKGSDFYEDWKYDKFATLPEFLDEFPALKLPVSLLIAQLPLLQARFYSISSCPELNPGEVHLTVAVVTYTTKAETTHHGVSSTWLSQLQEGQAVTCFVRKAPLFHLPEDMQSPVIMVGPGTGIAPFRSFWQRRLHLIKFHREGLKSAGGHPSSGVNALDLGLGKMKLFFGCRHDNIDNIYRKEIGENLLDGSLSKVCYAFSRDPNHPKHYVQERIEATTEAEQLVADICEKNGHVYVCGDGTMAVDVKRAFQNILVTIAAMSTAEASAYITQMKAAGRYHEDIFGVTLKTQEVTDGKRAAAKRLWAMSVKGHGAAKPKLKIRLIPSTVLGGRRASGGSSQPSLPGMKRSVSGMSGAAPRKQQPKLTPPRRISGGDPLSPQNSQVSPRTSVHEVLTEEDG